MEYIHLPLNPVRTNFPTNNNPVSAPVDINKSHISTCISVTQTTPSVSCSDRPPVPSVPDIDRAYMGELNGCMQMSGNQGNDSYMQPISSGIVNSLVDCDLPAANEVPAVVTTDVEPMDIVPTPPSPASDTANGVSVTTTESLLSLSSSVIDKDDKASANDELKSQGSSSETMLIDCEGHSVSGENPASDSHKLDSDDDVCVPLVSSTPKETSLLSVEDVSLIVDLFYMPFEHGAKAVNMLNEIHWLKCNAYVLTQSKNKKRSNQVKRMLFLDGSSVDRRLLQLLWLDPVCL